MKSSGTSRHFDVAVVGSGPAGCSAALGLASAGVAVVLLEKKRLPRYKTCGGGLVIRARRLLPIDVSAAVERECEVAEVNDLGSDVRVVVERAGPLISMTMREHLDYLLVCAAREAGAELWAGCTVRGVEERGDRVELTTSRGTVSARFVVAADGALSPTARAVGWKDDRRLIPALESEVRVGAKTFDRLSRAARFDFGVVPNGYAWVFPKRDHLSVGVLSTRRGAVRLPAHLERYYRQLGVHSIEREERHGSLIPFSMRKAGLARGRVLVAGDAAGFADPLTGEGISFAISSGQIAAQVLSETNCVPRDVQRLYQTRLESGVLRELRAGRRLAWLVYPLPGLRTWLLRRHGQRIGERLADVFSGDAMYPSGFRSWLRYLTPRVAPHSARE